MNHYTFEEIRVGQTERFTAHVTEAMMDFFRDISGDTNPLHTDRAYAQNAGHEDRVCYGMLTASFLSTLAGVYLPGERALLQTVETEFVKPVYPGDVLTIEGTVTEKHDIFRYIRVKAIITNQRGEKVCRAKLRTGVRA